MKNILIATEKPFASDAVSKITSTIEDAGFNAILLEKYKTKNELLEAVSSADAIIIRSDIVDNEVFDAAKQLKIVVRAGAGYDNIDLDSATRHNVVAMNTPGQNANAVAELVFGILIYGIRKRFEGQVGTELRGKNIGIQGYGNIGKLVAKIALGFGMNVYAYDPTIDSEIMKGDGVHHISSIEELFKTCQIITFHIPCCAKNRHFVNYELLKLLPANAILINTSRKEIINEDDFLRFMDEQKSTVYLSDIKPDKLNEFETLFSDRIFFTPVKSGAQTAEANTNAGIAAAKQIINYFNLGETKYQINN